MGVKYWDSNSIGDEEGHQGRIGVNSEGFLRCRMCAAPLESLGPVFHDGRGDRMNEQRSRVYQTRVGRGGYSEGRS